MESLLPQQPKPICPYTKICKFYDDNCKEYAKMFDCSRWTYFSGNVVSDLESKLIDEK